MGHHHARVMHSVGEYVRGAVSTNRNENYWSHLKRTYIGTNTTCPRSISPACHLAQPPLQPPPPDGVGPDGRSRSVDGRPSAVVVGVDRLTGCLTFRALVGRDQIGGPFEVLPGSHRLIDMIGPRLGIGHAGSE